MTHILPDPPLPRFSLTSSSATSLLCPVCRHVFCSSCLTSWLPLKPECPECRAPVESSSLSADRLADSLVANLGAYCQFRKAGCGWVGRRGERTAHMARECPCVPVFCPHDGCGAEVPRSDIADHLETCAFKPSLQVECPFGCGARCASAALDAHKSECLLEPQKLLAAVSKLALENERLTLENQRLLQEADGESEGGEPRTTRKARRRCGTGPGVSVE